MINILAEKMMNFPLLKRFVFVALMVFVQGCDSNNDIAMLAAYPTFGTCAIDIPKTGSILSIDQSFKVDGWAFDEKNKTTPSTLTLYFVNESNETLFPFPAKRGNQREDVAMLFKSPQLVNSGFNGLVPENALPPGTYRLVLLQADRYSGVIACNGLNHKIIIQ